MLQSVSFRREDAGRNRRHLDGISALKLEAARRYQLNPWRRYIIDLAPRGSAETHFQIGVEACPRYHSE
jgi:hypothetical protein